MMLTNQISKSDSVLLQLITEGNALAFNELYERYWEQVFNGVFKRLKDVDQAKDITQDIFIAIWERKGKPIDNLPAYLNIAVRNRVLKMIEKQKPVHPFFNKLEELSSSLRPTDGDVLWKEFYKAYESLVATLPEKRQEIFRLRFNEDLATKDIAAQMGISRKTVQNQLGKAVEHLKTSLLHLFSLLFVLLFF